MPGWRGDSAFWHGVPWDPWQWKSRCPFKRCPWALVCWGYGGHVPAQRLEKGCLSLTDVGSDWPFFPLAMHACSCEPQFPVTGRWRDDTHACSSPSFSPEQDMGWGTQDQLLCTSRPVLWLFQMNTWKIFITSLTLHFAFLYGNQGPVSIRLRGQCCPLTFIASLPNSWMGDKSD